MSPAFYSLLIVTSALGLLLYGSIVLHLHKKNNKASLFKTFVFLLFIVIVSASCQQKKQPSLSNTDISHVITKMTDIMVHDITNPPLAARFFAYSCLAGYEVVAQNDKVYKSMHGVLNEYPQIAKPDSIINYSAELSAIFAMIETAKKMQPSGKQFDAYEANLIDSCKRIGFDDEVVNNSMRYASYVSKKILAYAKADHYNQISNLARYTPSDKDGFWYPTPPGFLAAVEPNFNTVRTFTLDSAAQYKPAAPTVFNSAKNTSFFKLMNAVYEEGKQLPNDHRVIASFWDCNPFAMQDEGHLMFGFKKISPGSHWLGITGIACEKANKSFNETMKIYTAVSIGLMDGFVCCWDEKYRSNRIRPETAIRKYIDPTWQPLLQTPPFPEYLSGHSVVSAASSTILSHYFGNNFSFTDSVEVAYDLPPRSFNSFQQAAQEAAISRFYGGIHFMDAIENGLTQGQKVGEHVLAVLQKID